MGDEFNRSKNYESIGDLLGERVTPLLEVLCRLSDACLHYAAAAASVSNVNVTETHEIKELLDLAFDIRKLSERTLDALEDRLEDVLDEIKKECD